MPDYRAEKAAEKALAVPPWEHADTGDGEPAAPDVPDVEVDADVTDAAGVVDENA